MSVALNDAQVMKLVAALRVLATPLAHSDLLGWLGAVTEQCVDLVGAHQALFAISAKDRLLVFPFGAHAADAAREYMEYYWRYDFVVAERRVELGRETYHRNMLYRPGEVAHDLVYNEWSVPNRFREQIGMTAEAKNPMLAGIHFYHESQSAEFRERGVALLDLLLPAFKAGVYTWLSLNERRGAYLTSLDAVADGVLILTPRGEILAESSSLTATLSREPERDRVLQAMRCAGAALGVLIDRKMDIRSQEAKLEPMVRELQTRLASYRIVATCVPKDTIAPTAAAAVALSRHATRRVQPELLQDRFGLTPREIEVAGLIASGLRNDEIASTLGLSSHTTLRHTERVLRKLGVHSRAAVAAIVLGVDR